MTTKCTTIKLKKLKFIIHMKIIDNIFYESSMFVISLSKIITVL